MLCGLWNGLLVAVLDIQPIIATLILMVAGRGIALLIDEGLIVTFRSDFFSAISTGQFLTVPSRIIVCAGTLAVSLADPAPHRARPVHRVGRRQLRRGRSCGHQRQAGQDRRLHAVRAVLGLSGRADLRRYPRFGQQQRRPVHRTRRDPRRGDRRRLAGGRPLLSRIDHRRRPHHPGLDHLHPGERSAGPIQHDRQGRGRVDRAAAAGRAGFARASSACSGGERHEGYDICRSSRRSPCSCSSTPSAPSVSDISCRRACWATC